MIKRERKYATKLMSQNDKVLRLHSERGNSPVSSAAMTEITDSTHDPMIVRKGVCEWMYRIIDHYKLERDVIPIAMSCFDRFVKARTSGSTTELSKSMYQLIAVSSLHITIKSHCCTRANFLPAFVKLSHNRFTSNDILLMECQMLQELEWNVNHPTPQAFASEMILMLSHVLPRKSLEMIMEVANYIIECAYLQPEYYQENHSTLSFSAIIVSLREVKHKILPPTASMQLCEKITTLLNCDFERILDMGIAMQAMYDHESAQMTLRELYQNVDPHGLVYEL